MFFIFNLFLDDLAPLPDSKNNKDPELEDQQKALTSSLKNKLAELPPRKNPQRNVPKVDYKEEKVPPEDAYICEYDLLFIISIPLRKPNTKNCCRNRNTGQCMQFYFESTKRL